MFKRIILYKKFKDYYNFEEFEVYFSISISALMVTFLFIIDFYDEFAYYIETIENLLLNLIGGSIGLLGFILAGVALIVGLFNRKINNKIDEVNNKKDSIIKILSSFEFAALSTGFEIVMLIFMYLLLSTGLKFNSQFLYYSTCFGIFYLIMFNLFYTISLVYNSVSLYEIFLIYSNIIEEETSENK